jgi:phosphopantetheinyl transferase
LLRCGGVASEVTATGTEADRRQVAAVVRPCGRRPREDPDFYSPAVLNIVRDVRYLKGMAATAKSTSRHYPPPAGIVHLWPASLDGARCVDALSLSEPERDRIALRPGVAGHRFALAHAALRQVVAAYDGCAPQEAGLVAAYGKPPLAPQGLHVSLAHCDDLALIAVATSAVGVDIEPLSSEPSDPEELWELAHATLTAAELDLLVDQGDTREQAELWLRPWVRKEAALKARGVGLGEIPLFELDAGAERLEELAFVDLAPGATHIAAVALAAPGVQVEWKELDDVT